jgi:two-component system response regulator QseB
LIAEEDATTSAALVGVIAQMGGMAAVRWDEDEAWLALRSSPFDILLLGVRRGATRVPALLRRLRSTCSEQVQPDPKLPVLLVCGSSHPHLRWELLDAGADQYILKPVNPSLVAAMIRALVRRRLSPALSALEFGAFQLDAEQFMVMQGDTEIQLTPTQMKILTMLACESPRVVSRQRLMASCSPQRLSAGALESHVHYLRKHLGRHTIQTVRGGGYQLLAATEWPSRATPNSL